VKTKAHPLDELSVEQVQALADEFCKRNNPLLEAIMERLHTFAMKGDALNLHFFASSVQQIIEKSNDDCKEVIKDMQAIQDGRLDN